MAFLLLKSQPSQPSLHQEINTMYAVFVSAHMNLPKVFKICNSDCESENLMQQYSSHHLNLNWPLAIEKCISAPHPFILVLLPILSS